MGSKFKIGKAFYSELKESIGDLGRRYREETGKKRSSIMDKEFRKIVQDRVNRTLEADRYVKKSLNGSTKKYNELMKVRDKFSGGGTMNKKKKKTKDPLVEKYRRVRNTILVAPEVQALGDFVNDLIGMGGFDDGGLNEGIKSVKASEKQAPPSKKASEMQAPPSRRVGEINKRGMTKKPRDAFRKSLRKRAEGGFTDNRKKIDKAPPFGVINADDFKALKAMKKSTGGSIVVPVKMGKNKPTKIM